MAQYRVEVEGHVAARFTEAFDVLLVEMRGGRTILTVDLQDQAALHGLLARFRDLGLPLISVVQVEEPT